MRYFIILLACSTVMLSCAKRVTTSGASAGTGKYTEDLSVWRPQAETVVERATPTTTTAPERIRVNTYVEPRYAVNNQVDSVLNSIHEQNLNAGFVDGYTIQVYSGIKREDALNIKKRMTQSLPELESDVQYRQPNFRVRTGKYLSRLEAQKDYLSVKRHFPNAIVIPERISIR